MSAAPTDAISGEAEPQPEPEVSPEEKYNRQVNFAGAQLEVLPLYDQVVPGFVNKLPTLFQFVTGSDPNLRRDPFSLAVVLDVSGSMQGTKLQRCKTAISQLIDATDDDDILSLVVYDDKVKVVFDGIRCGDREARKNMKELLLAVEVGGTTDLYGGLLAGYNLLQTHASDISKHMFLLSDGAVNAGLVQSTDAILKAVSEWQEKIPILSYGIGDDFNEKLMSPLGQVHRGSHYFYITDAGSIERLIAKGVRALTGAVARNVRLHVKPLTNGVWFPDIMIDGASFPLVRERSVIQFLVDLEVRPELFRSQASSELQKDDAGNNPGGQWGAWFCSKRKTHVTTIHSQALKFAWEVQDFPLLAQSSGSVVLRAASDRGMKNQEVQAFLDIKRGCELRRNAAGSPEARKMCEEALQLFEGCLSCDRFGFAQEWAKKTKDLLEDASFWRGNAASEGAAKHLGVAYQSANVDDDEEEEDMDFDLFG